MFCETRLSSQYSLSSDSKPPDAVHGLNAGWYSPEALKQLQQVFDAVWIKVRERVFPWDVHATRETLAASIFDHVKDARDAEDLKTQILTSIEPVHRGKLRGSRTH